ncbi:MAG TPA: sulfatase-like hydrolase/transferase, partial [Burkholderiales bacterium]|nr:sulfatase-like hydrolase/transferase [Burkholderiales bacterium]
MNRTAIALLALIAAPAFAQAPAPVLPKPDAPFKGKIGPTWKESKPDYPRPLAAPKGAPNVLLILTDDTGFGHASTYGGAVPTPAIDRLAANGLRYNRFHTTALCSPTRAALLTGRNHHSVGTGVIIEMGTGYPGYTGLVPSSAAGLPQILRMNGYATAAFGKWHNTPATEISPGGPFDRWPTGNTWGFETFYGFMNGETNQWYPVLYRNISPVPAPRTPEQGYHLTEDLADEAIAWINGVNATDPNKPWFLYFSTGGIHAPHHAPKSYRDKYKGR